MLIRIFFFKPENICNVMVLFVPMLICLLVISHLDISSYSFHPAEMKLDIPAHNSHKDQVCT